MLSFAAHLKVKDLCALAVTSRQWAFVLDDDELWKKYAKLHWKGDLHFRGTWKRSVLDRHKKKAHDRDYKANHKEPRRVPGTARWYKVDLDAPCLRLDLDFAFFFFFY